ncbi:hypothetical protein E0H75_12725 [Kribbella capetownensis]|uniref:Uncharacterized protein n=1 Tax=Kribbella capetownensis TaxID=1572659 RepID=A0A4R0JXN1_9ACTN|nr:hypothetical protein [Kribbella capetownensis]TCC51004.1 hypothetical protein E0H75_12725 [Kribbella capetownensis]
MAVVRINPSSEEYRRFVHLYEVARALRPSKIDRWNRELYATVGEADCWGSLQPDGSFKFSKELVFDKLGDHATPQERVQALTTVLHESNHARVQIDAADEPNAVRSRHSKSLDEGLTEWISVDDVAMFADRAGYGELPDPPAAYPAAYHAANSLLEYPAGADAARRTADRAIDAPVVMRWDVITDEIVKNKLADVVPRDPQHQQAARAELINAMTQLSWGHLDTSQPIVGPVVARDTTRALDNATQRVRDHYTKSPSTPYPTKTASAVSQPHDPGAEMRVLTGLAPAAQAPLSMPELGDRARTDAAHGRVSSSRRGSPNRFGRPVVREP